MFKKIKKIFKSNERYYYLLKKYNTLELNYESLQEEYKKAVFKEYIDLKDKTNECESLKEDLKKLKIRIKNLQNELKELKLDKK